MITISREELFRKILVTIAFVIIVAIFFITGLVFSIVNEYSGTSWWIWIIFSLPLITDILGWFFIHQELHKLGTSQSELEKSKTDLDIELNTFKTKSQNNPLTKEEMAEVSHKEEKLKEIINDHDEKKKNHEGINTFCSFYNITMLLSVFLYCMRWSNYSAQKTLCKMRV